MAEDEQESENTEAPAAASDDAGEEDDGGKKKLILMIAAVVIVLLGAGAGVYFSGILGGGDEAKAEEEAHAEDGHGEEHAEDDEYSDSDEHAGDDEHAASDDGHGASADDGHGKDGKGGAAEKFLEIPPMVVNLNTEDGTPRYLRLSVQLELANPSQAPAVKAVMPRVIDQFQTYLRELRVKDLRGSAGIYRLQMELLWRVNKAAKPVKIKDVLFQEILIQ